MLRKVVISILCLIVLVFSIPITFLALHSDEPEVTQNVDKTDETGEENTLPVGAEADPSASPIAVGTKEPMDTISVYIASEDRVEEMDFSEYLKCSVAAEMPASFEEEALKAQAVAVRTYIIQRAEYYQENGTPEEHKGALTCTDSTHCKGWVSKEEKIKTWGVDGELYWKKISDAVDSTCGVIMMYDGKPINAVFHAMSSGATEDAKDVWGSDVPYLKSVDSSLDKNAPKYETTLSMTKEEMKQKMAENIPGVDFSDGIFGEIERTATGSITSIEIGKVKIKGSEFRSILDLRSTNVSFNVVGDVIHMTIHGYGHGVGMSQYGANFLAQEGKNYQEILNAYYTGIELVAYTEQ